MQSAFSLFPRVERLLPLLLLRSEHQRAQYWFISAPIAKALVDAKKRAGKVVALQDKSQGREKYTAADLLVHPNIPT